MANRAYRRAGVGPDGVGWDEPAPARQSWCTGIGFEDPVDSSCSASLTLARAASAAAPPCPGGY